MFKKCFGALGSKTFLSLLKTDVSKLDYKLDISIIQSMNLKVKYMFIIVIGESVMV
jgi:hypothetical protein